MTQKNFKYPFDLDDLPYVEDFTGTDGDPLRPEFWEPSSFTINTNMAYMPSGTSTTTTSSKFSLSGDFNIQIDVSTTAQPASEYWMMQMFVKIDDSNNVHTSLGYFNGNFVYISRKKLNDVYTDVFVSVQSAGAVASGTLKVSRTDNVFYFGVNEITLSSYDYGSAPDIQDVLLSHTNTTGSNIGSSWDNFTINSVDDISWNYNFMDTFDGVDTDDPAENLWKNVIEESNTTKGLLDNKLRYTCSTGTNADIVDVSKFKLNGDFDVQIDMEDISKITPSASKSYGYHFFITKEDQYISDNLITDNYIHSRVGFTSTSLSNTITTKCMWSGNILTSGGVYSWGFNGFGQCNHTDQVTPAYDETTVRISGVKAIAGGNNYTVVLKENGDVHTWGSNNYGQCNHTNTTTPAYDEDTVRMSGVKAIACGDNHTIVLKENGDVHSWGYNGYGQCNHTNTTSPVYDEDTIRMSGVKVIACGRYHTVVLKENGDVHSWGANNYGQCNHTDTTNPAYDEDTVRISGVKAIAGGDYHTVVLKENGDVHSWGYNEFGQCNHTNTTSPVYDEDTIRMSGVKVIACGGYHTVVLKENGDVHSWGYNTYGQCNHTNTTSPAYDEDTVRMSGVKVIACGGYHTVVLGEFSEHPFIGTSQKIRMTRTISGGDSTINVFATDLGTTTETHMINDLIIPGYIGNFDIILKQDNDDLNTDALSCDFNNFIINSCDKIVWPGGTLKRWDGVNWIPTVVNKWNGVDDWEDSILKRHDGSTWEYVGNIE